VYSLDSIFSCHMCLSHHLICYCFICELVACMFGYDNGMQGIYMCSSIYYIDVEMIGFGILVT
jgi:hypothetical protein